MFPLLNLNYDAPQEGTRAGSSRPAFSLFHPFSPFRHPLGITISLQTKQSRGTAGQRRGPAGDSVGAPDCGLPGESAVTVPAQGGVAPQGAVHLREGQ